MLKFTEYYYDDALRMAMYIREREGGEIELVKVKPDGFPFPPKMQVYGETVDCIRIGGYEIAYFAKRLSPDEDKKHRNRCLYRFMIGRQIKEAREAKGLTLDDLSQRTGYKVGSLRNMELGRYGVDIQMLCCIAEALGVRVAFTAE